jgi:hypothetical protein
MCLIVGLYSRFTMYSFRRTAIIETCRVEGTETAKDFAGVTINTAPLLHFRRDVPFDQSETQQL